MSKQEYILCAAIWWDDGLESIDDQPHNIETGFVVCGYRHLAILNFVYVHDLGVEGCREVQGFLTNLNRFVDREEAWQIAEAAGQRINNENKHKILFSEDLY